LRHPAWRCCFFFSPPPSIFFNFVWLGVVLLPCCVFVFVKGAFLNSVETVAKRLCPPARFFPAGRSIPLFSCFFPLDMSPLACYRQHLSPLPSWWAPGFKIFHVFLVAHTLHIGTFRCVLFPTGRHPHFTPLIQSKGLAPPLTYLDPAKL